MISKIKERRSLYQCGNAKVKNKRIVCVAGHKLKVAHGAADGSLNWLGLVRGEALVCQVCQDCPDFDCWGEQIPKEERGFSIPKVELT